MFVFSLLQDQYIAPLLPSKFITSITKYITCSLFFPLIIHIDILILMVMLVDILMLMLIDKLLLVNMLML